MAPSIHEPPRRPPRGAQGYDINDNDLNGNDYDDNSTSNRTFSCCSEPDIFTLP